VLSPIRAASCAEVWIGNRALIAAKHLQMTEADFMRAAKSGAIQPEKALRNAVPQEAEAGRTKSQERS
jgi:hypothetical protein